MLKMKILLAVSLVVFIMLSGCITNGPHFPSNERKIIEITTGNSLKISFYEIENITFDQINNITVLGYGYENLSQSNNYKAYHVFFKNYSQKDRMINIEIIAQNESDGRMRARYSPAINFPGSNLSEKKQYLKERVDEIATICNLTVNWTQVQWAVSYAD